VGAYRGHDVPESAVGVSDEVMLNKNLKPINRRAPVSDQQ
jgi:hypothetical protein